MEAIKISVEVSVDLSKNTQDFIKSLFGQCQCQCNQVDAPAAKPTSAPTSTAEPAKTQPAAKPAPSAPAAPAASSASKSIEDVRGMLAKKVNEHRDAIKQKLTELGAPSVTKLDPLKYDEMYNFLASL